MKSLMWKTDMKTGTNWLHQGEIVEELPKDCEAFVYLITNTTNGMMYVGKKLAKFKTTKKPLKGRKNKRRGTKESDWKTYWGSSEQLQDDILKLGEHRFTREILHYCPSRGVASYIEAQEQFDRKVLETDDYYNGIINVRIGGSKILRESLKKMSKNKFV